MSDGAWSLTLHLGDPLFELIHLDTEEILVIARSCEVRHDPGKCKVASRHHFLDDAECLGRVRCTESSHAGVQLYVHVGSRWQARRPLLPPHHNMSLNLRGGFQLIRSERPEHDDRGANPSLAQFDRLVGCGDEQTGCTSFDCCLSRRHSSMAVCVRLDYCPEARSLVKSSDYGLTVVPDRGEIDSRPGPMLRARRLSHTSIPRERVGRSSCTLEPTCVTSSPLASNHGATRGNIGLRVPLDFRHRRGSSELDRFG